jgi:hypothetical protein
VRPVREGGKSSLPGRIVLLALILAGFGLLGCGEVIDKSKLDAQVQSELEETLPAALENGAAGEQLQKELGITPNEKIASVDCPSEQKIDPGTKFSCPIEFSNGSKAKEIMLIRDKEADLKVVALEASK